MTKWISVKDELPPIDQKVIVWDSEFPDMDSMRMGYYDQDYEASTGWRCNEYMDLTVTHWMSLPQPPKED